MKTFTVIGKDKKGKLFETSVEYDEKDKKYLDMWIERAKEAVSKKATPEYIIKWEDKIVDKIINI